MPLHDAYARLTPIEVAFSDGSSLEELSVAVAEESRRRDADDTRPEVFMRCTSVGDHLRRLHAPDVSPEATYPLASLLFHGVHFLRAGRPLYLLATPVTRVLTAGRFASGGTLAGPVEPPGAAGYVQLPRHLVWTDATAAGGSGAPESLDGFFWTVSTPGTLHVLPISGLHPERAGFGALPLPEAPLSDATVWLDASVRPSEDDFASSLPGGELDELYSVHTAGEVLKLLARFFVLVRDAGARLEARVPSVGVWGRGGGTGERPVGDPRPSALPYTRVSLGE